VKYTVSKLYPITNYQLCPTDLMCGSNYSYSHPVHPIRHHLCGTQYSQLQPSGGCNKVKTRNRPIYSK